MPPTSVALRTVRIFICLLAFLLAAHNVAVRLKLQRSTNHPTVWAIVVNPVDDLPAIRCRGALRRFRGGLSAATSPAGRLRVENPRAVLAGR